MSKAFDRLCLLGCVLVAFGVCMTVVDSVRRNPTPKPYFAIKHVGPIDPTFAVPESPLRSTP